MAKIAYKNISDIEEENPQSPHKYRVYRCLKTDNGEVIYNLSKLYKDGNYRMSNYPFVFKSTSEAKKICKSLLQLEKINVSMKDIEVVSLF